MPVRANAAARFDPYPIGNGRHNRNDVTINSPTFNRGVQHISNGNVQDNAITQASFCKGRFRHCRLVQRAVNRGGW